LRVDRSSLSLLASPTVQLLSTNSKILSHFYFIFSNILEFFWLPYAFQSFQEDVSVPWLVLHAHEPAESSVDSDLSTHTSRRVIGSNVSTTGTQNKSLLDAPQMPGPSDSSSSSYDTASPVHFHGLADTQTQTQVTFSAEATGQGGAMPQTRVCILLISNLARMFPLLDPVSVEVTDIFSVVLGGQKEEIVS
jgi:hypothetical protein